MPHRLVATVSRRQVYRTAQALARRMQVDRRVVLVESAVTDRAVCQRLGCVGFAVNSECRQPSLAHKASAAWARYEATADTRWSADIRGGGAGSR